MWKNWLEPIECVAARAALTRDDPAQAAQCLLDSPRLRHRACQELLAQIQPQLVEHAECWLESSDPAEALEMLRLAERCGTATERLRQLAARCESQLREQQAEANWRTGRIQEARRLADQGRLVSAVDWVESLDGDPELSHERRDWRKKAARVDACAQQAEVHLAAGRLAAAAICVRKAQELAASDPRVVELVKRIGDDGGAISDGEEIVGVSLASALDSATSSLPTPVDPSPEPPQQPPTQPSARMTGVQSTKPAARPQSGVGVKVPASFVISSGQDQVLVLSKREVVAGAAGGCDIDLPLIGRMHERQCLLLRDGSDVRLLAYNSGLVTVNGQPCAAGVARTLVDVTGSSSNGSGADSTSVGSTDAPPLATPKSKPTMPQPPGTGTPPTAHWSSWPI